MPTSFPAGSRRAARERAHNRQRKRTDHHRIGDVARFTGLSVDTLRYYEKIGLLGPIARTVSGIRLYTDKDVSRLNFVRRAQKMNFSLTEIASLLKMREDPQRARTGVRELTAAKLAEVEARLSEITSLRDELQLLLNICRASTDGCPIIDSIDAGPKHTPGRTPPNARKTRQR